MKYFVTILILCFSMSCVSLHNPKTPYDGKWKLLHKTGGITGQTFAAEKEVILEIKKGKLTRKENGQLILESKFEIIQGKVIETTEPKDLLNTQALIKQSIALHGDTLVLKDQCFDCFTYVYTKMK